MSAIIAPPEGRRSHSAQVYNRASEQIGVNSQVFNQRETVDPATMLKADKNFRKASVSSSKGLWIQEKDMDLITEKRLTKHEVCKAQSRDRYYSS